MHVGNDNQSKSNLTIYDEGRLKVKQFDLIIIWHLIFRRYYE